MQTNNHLKAKIEEMNNFLKNHTHPPEDLFDAFMLELRVSNLLIPGKVNGDEIDFEHLESDDGMEILTLFTDNDQYSGENTLHQFPFGFYADVVGDCDFDGIVVNPESDEFFITREMMRGLGDDFEITGESLDAESLKELAFSVKNEELVNFISNEDNFNRFDELIEILSRSVLLDVVSSRNDLSDFAHDGILNTLEVGGFSLSVKSEGMEKYGLMFTDLDAIKRTCDVNAGVNYYVQITSMKDILEFILGNDLEGIIINPGIQEYYVPRNVLLDIYANHPEIVGNPKYMQATFYAFVFF